MTVKIKGIIGWDVVGTDFADMLSRFTGDIDFEIDSPGGSVFDGITIFNAIKNYDKGKCRMHVVGNCSSMAAYIMLAGDGEVDFEPNSIVVLHNPWSYASGDYRDMKKKSEVLEQMAALYAQEFVKKGLFEEKEIRQIMDEETWFIGAKALKKLGNVLGEENEENDNSETQKEIRMAALREKISEAQSRLKAQKNSKDETEKIAALICKSENEINSFKQRPEMKAECNSKENQKGDVEMVATLDELKAQSPSIYEEAKCDGVKNEQARVAALMKFIDIDKNAVIDAIANGKTISDDDFQSSILMAKVKQAEIKAMEDESPKDIEPKEETHAKEGEENGEATEEEKAAAQAKAEEEKFNALISRMRNA